MICDKMNFKQTRPDLYFAGSCAMSYGLNVFPELTELYEPIYSGIEMHMDEIKPECFVKMFSNMKVLNEKNQFDACVKYFSHSFLKLVQFISVEFKKPNLIDVNFNEFKTHMESIDASFDQDMNFDFEVKK